MFRLYRLVVCVFSFVFSYTYLLKYQMNTDGGTAFSIMTRFNFIHNTYAFYTIRGTLSFVIAICSHTKLEFFTNQLICSAATIVGMLHVEHNKRSNRIYTTLCTIIFIMRTMQVDRINFPTKTRTVDMPIKMYGEKKKPAAANALFFLHPFVFLSILRIGS